MRTVVVGAGLAGLVAADELARGGAEVVVLEARSRVGGRVWSERLPNGAVVEMGAEFILPGNTAIRELVDRFDLGLWDKGMHYGRRDPSGGIGTTHEELAAAVAEVERALAEGAAARASGAAALSARDFLDGLDIPAGAREAILARVEISSANSAERVAAADLAGVAHIDDEPAPSIAGGNQRLPLALAESLGSAVRLDSPVSAVEWGERVRVLTPGGELDADACVIAVPASVLDRIAFDPPLPAGSPSRSPRSHTATRRSSSSRSARPAEPSAVMNVPERYWSWTASGEGGPHPTRSERVRGLEAGARRARGRGRTGALARLARATAGRPRPGPRRGAPVHMGGRPVGRSRVLHLPTPVSGGGGRGAHRPARVRGRAHGRALRRADGGRYPERAARRPLAAAPGTRVTSR